MTLLRSTLLLTALLPLASRVAAETQILFNRDIRPILSENCFHCHGPDPGTRKAGLRLDTKEGFFAGTEKRGPTIVSGKPTESPLYERIMTTDEDDVMPPPESHKTLKPQEKEVLRKWIELGAPWQPHWSFIKPERPAVPVALAEGFPIRNPVDAFVLEKLRENSLSPALEADRRTLARRLSLDLTGLVPSLEEAAAFVADTSPDYYEKYVDQLMARPEYGEHRGRYWLDAARYADTHGLHFDNYREIWPFRDWVINALNQNKPFDQFTIEQIAGDLLPNPTKDQLAATGFHRCNITTNEGGTIPEENLANYARERVETTSWVWLGITANCATCHDHKFDPVTMKDFYSMSAFFRNTTQAAMDGNVRDTAPSIRMPEMGPNRIRWTALPAEIAAAKQEVTTRQQAALSQFEKWLAALKPDEVQKSLNSASLVAHLPLNEGQGDEVMDACGSTARKFKALAPVVWQSGGKLGSAPNLKREAHFDLGNVGDFEKDRPFSYGCWVNIPKGFGGYAGIIARMDDQNDYRGWDLFCHGGIEFAMHLVNKWPQDAMKVVTTSKAVKQGAWQHVFVAYDGSGKPEGVKTFVNGQEQPTAVENNSLKSSIRTSVPLKVGQRHSGQHLDGASLQDVRVYSRKLEPVEIKALAEHSQLTLVASLDPSERTPQHRQQMLDYYLGTFEKNWQVANQKVSALENEFKNLEESAPVAHIQRERMDSQPAAAVLYRGQYDQPREKVGPATFAALHTFPADAPKSRLGLARWIMSSENPLTARVTVNRFWQELFGVGLVRTAEDFGIMGEAPVNQKLLDWLAVEFREGGWDMKKLVKLLVTSSTYRQSAAATPEKLEKDPLNRLVSRGPRFRMDAEMLRDMALATSGSLVRKIGGPSVKPYQPEGVWEAVAMPESNTKRYEADKGEGLYRRSLYTFWKRAAPPASMEIFNATAREVSCLRRERTNTPLQALVTLNDPQFIEASRLLAENALKSASGDPDKTIDALTQRILCRSFRPEEVAIVKATQQDLLKHYQNAAEEAKKLITVGASQPAPNQDAAGLASWTMVANQILNLDEALSK